MNDIIGVGILIAIFLYGCFLYIRWKRIERLKPSDLDIPAFLRRDYAENNSVSDGEAYPTRVCRIRKTE